ncbi:MAG: DsbE family thiol:disulfide interchange protein [Rubrivivax sp.]|jgi:cytochrome c biogenesis protein CcmG/thiol:disulfide interchange protein DsbE|nr:DsbE family thiol:disulfide interchange protein [Rubrivivax sp.]
MKRLHLLLPLAIFAVVAGFLAVGLGLNPREVPSPLIGKPAPDFSLPRLDEPGRVVKRDDLLGQVWVLNVWASWCAPCREEHPLVIDLARRSGVPVYGLNYKDNRNAAMQWLAGLGDPYRATLFDPEGRVGIDFGVYGVPETFVIDRQGIVRLKHTGPLTPDVLRERVEPLLRELSGRG